MILDGVHYIECNCSSEEHVLRFIVDKEEDAVYVHHFLANGPWYKRIMPGIKYIFGKKSKYGHFDETVLDREQAHRLIKILADFIK